MDAAQDSLPARSWALELTSCALRRAPTGRAAARHPYTPTWRWAESLNSSRLLRRLTQWILYPRVKKKYKHNLKHNLWFWGEHEHNKIININSNDNRIYFHGSFQTHLKKNWRWLIIYILLYVSRLCFPSVTIIRGSTSHCWWLGSPTASTQEAEGSYVLHLRLF